MSDLGFGMGAVGSFAPRAASPVAAFVPWGRRLEMRAPTGFTDGDEEEDVFTAPPAPVIDPEAIAMDGFARGFEEGRRVLEGELAAERQALATLAASLQALRPEPPTALATLIANTVGLLVRQIVGGAPVDPELLRARAEGAAALIAEEARPARMRLHPDDLARLAGADLPVERVADAGLLPGTVVVECRDGWIEDGPAVALGRMQMQLDRMAVPR